MDRSTRRIRFVWNYLDWGGANVYLLAIMKEAAGEWDMEVLLPVGSSQDILDMITAVDVRYRLIDACLDKAPAPTFPRKLQRQWRRIRAEIVTYRELKKEKLKDLVIHCELAAWQSWIFYWLLCRQGAQVFFTLHNELPEHPRWRNVIWNWRLGFLSRQRGFHIFPANQHAKNKLRHRVTPEFWRTLPVTYTSVNPDEIEAARRGPFDRGQSRRDHAIPADAFVVLTAARFTDPKGRWTLLDAARLVTEATDEVYFVWVTPDLPDDGDMQRVDAYGLGERFQLVRSRDAGTDRVDFLKFFRIADVFTLPSFLEGLPIAVMEGMAMGLAAISTNIFGIPEAIIDRETGLLIEPGDSEQLASAILELYRDDALRDRLAAKGREHVLATFDERVAARTAIAHYKKSLDG